MYSHNDLLIFLWNLDEMMNGESMQFPPKWIFETPSSWLNFQSFRYWIPFLPAGLLYRPRPRVVEWGLASIEFEINKTECVSVMGTICNSWLENTKLLLCLAFFYFFWRYWFLARLLEAIEVCAMVAKAWMILLRHTLIKCTLSFLECNF